MPDLSHFGLHSAYEVKLWKDQQLIDSILLLNLRFLAYL